MHEDNRCMSEDLRCMPVNTIDVCMYMKTIEACVKTILTFVCKGKMCVRMCVYVVCVCMSFSIDTLFTSAGAYMESDVERKCI